jgi:hypothetical protein
MSCHVPSREFYAGALFKTGKISCGPLFLTLPTQSGRLHLAFARQTVVWNGHANVGLGVFDVDQCANCDGVVEIISKPLWEGRGCLLVVGVAKYE